MSHYNHSTSVDAKIMELKKCPIIDEHAAVNYASIITTITKHSNKMTRYKAPSSQNWAR